MKFMIAATIFCGWLLSPAMAEDMVNTPPPQPAVNLQAEELLPAPAPVPVPEKAAVEVAPAAQPNATTATPARQGCNHAKTVYLTN